MVLARLGLGSCVRAWSPRRNHIPGEIPNFPGINLPSTEFNFSPGLWRFSSTATGMIF